MSASSTLNQQVGQPADGFWVVVAVKYELLPSMDGLQECAQGMCFPPLKVPVVAHGGSAFNGIRPLGEEPCCTAFMTWTSQPQPV